MVAAEVEVMPPQTDDVSLHISSVWNTLQRNQWLTDLIQRPIWRHGRNPPPAQIHPRP